MASWLFWTLSTESETRLNEILRGHSQHHDAWRNLMARASPSDSSTSLCERDSPVRKDPAEIEVANLIKESLEAGVVLPEHELTGIPYNSLNRILSLIKESVNASQLSILCKCILNWNSDVLVEDCLRLVVLPKMKEFPEVSACVTFAVKELALNKPEALIHQLLVPLLTDEIAENFDFEFFSEVFSILNSELKDVLIMSIINKNSFKESDWMLLDALLENLTTGTLNNICVFSNKFGKEFSNSQVFGKFLVNFCRRTTHITNKKLLLEVINQHQTLFKKQALKILDFS